MNPHRIQHHYKDRGRRLGAILRQIFILILLMAVQTGHAIGDQAQGPKVDCNKLLSPSVQPNPELVFKLYRHAHKRTRGLTNPFLIAGDDADKIGIIENHYREILPGYSELIMDAQKPTYTETQYVAHRDRILSSAVRILKNKHATAEQLFAVQEALRIFSVVEGRTEFEPPHSQKAESESAKKKSDEEQDDAESQEQEGKDQDKDQDQDQDQDQQSKSGKDKQKQKPQWNKPQSQYKPKNKKVDMSGGGEEAILMESDAQSTSRLLPQVAYDVITPTFLTSNPVGRPYYANASAVKPTNIMRVFPHGAADVKIPVPYGYDVVTGNYPGGTVVKDSTGEYTLIVTEAKDSVEIKLRDMRSEQLEFLSPLELKNYTQPTGIRKEDWPPEFRAFMEDLARRKAGDPHGAAQELSEHIKSTCTYYSKGSSNGKKVDQAFLDKTDKQLAGLMQQYPEPAAYAHLRAFNCDGAAWIAASLLRDFMQVPCRVIGGRTSNNIERNGARLMAVKSSSSAHAWIEVWDGHHWKPYDPTPQFTPKQDKKDKSQSDQKKDWKDLPDEGAEQEQSDQQQSQDSKSDSKSDSQSESQKDAGSEGDPSQSKELSKDQRSEKNQRPSKGASETPKSTEEKGAGDKASEAAKGADEKGTKNTPVSAAATGDRELKPFEIEDAEASSTQKDPLLQAVMEGLHTATWESLLTTGKKELQRTRAWIDSLCTKPNTMPLLTSNSKRLDALLETEISKRSKHGPGSLAQRVSDLRLKASRGEFREAWIDTKAIEADVQELAKHRSLSAAERKILDEAQKVLQAMRKIRHKDSALYDLTSKIFNALPGNISRLWVRNTYGDVGELGGMASQKFGADLESGHLNHLIRMGLLKDFTDLVLNGESVPSWAWTKTSDRAIIPNNVKDVVIARSPLEFFSMILQPRPGESIWAPLFRGEQFAINSRELVKTPNPVHPLERKVTVVLWDVSGSMKDKPMLVQESLLAAIVDKALSDVDLSGKPLHEVILVPFGDTPHPGRRIKSVEEALAYITEITQTTTTPAEGTNIELALINAYDTIAEAHRDPTAPATRALKRANLVLCTDGGSEVEIAKVLNAREQIPKEVTINMNFVAINGTNQQLIELAKSSNLSSQKPLYREIPAQMVIKLTSGALIPPRDEDAFATEAKAMQAPVEMTVALNQLTQSASINFITNIEATELESKISLIRNANTNTTEVHPAFITLTLLVDRLTLIKDMPTPVKQKILHQVFDVYPRLTRRSLNNINLFEKKKLEALIEWAR